MVVSCAFCLVILHLRKVAVRGMQTGDSFLTSALAGRTAPVAMLKWEPKDDTPKSNPFINRLSFCLFFLPPEPIVSYPSHRVICNRRMHSCAANTHYSTVLYGLQHLAFARPQRSLRQHVNRNESQS